MVRNVAGETVMVQSFWSSKVAAQAAAAIILAEFQAIKFWRGLFEGSWNVVASAMKRRSTFRPPRVYSLNKLLLIALGGSVSLFEEDVSARCCWMLCGRISKCSLWYLFQSLSMVSFAEFVARRSPINQKISNQGKFDRTKVFKSPALSAISRIRSHICRSQIQTRLIAFVVGPARLLHARRLAKAMSNQCHPDPTQLLTIVSSSEHQFIMIRFVYPLSNCPGKVATLLCKYKITKCFENPCFTRRCFARLKPWLKRTTQILHGSAEMMHYRMILFVKFALGSTKTDHHSTLWITDIDELFVVILWFGFWCGRSILRLHVGRPCQPLGKLVHCSIVYTAVVAGLRAESTIIVHHIFLPKLICSKNVFPCNYFISKPAQIFKTEQQRTTKTFGGLSLQDCH